MKQVQSKQIKKKQNITHISFNSYIYSNAKKKIVGQQHDIIIQKEYLFYEQLSQIIRHKFSEDAPELFKNYMYQALSQINCQEEVEQQQISPDIYSFLKKHPVASLQFCYKCRFAATEQFQDLIYTFANPYNIKQIKKIYQIPDARNDEIIINIVYHLVKFLHLYNKENLELIYLIKHYHVNLPQVLQTKRTSVAAGTNLDHDEDSDSFFKHDTDIKYDQLERFFFNYLTLVMGEFIQTSNQACAIIQQILDLLRASSIKQFIYQKTCIYCDCRIQQQKCVRSSAFLQLCQLTCNSISAQTVDIIQTLCMLRSWLKFTEKAAGKTILELVQFYASRNIIDQEQGQGQDETTQSQNKQIQNNQIVSKSAQIMQLDQQLRSIDLELVEFDVSQQGQSQTLLQLSNSINLKESREMELYVSKVRQEIKQTVNQTRNMIEKQEIDDLFNSKKYLKQLVVQGYHQQQINTINSQQHEMDSLMDILE